jgi:hypothetical protein
MLVCAVVLSQIVRVILAFSQQGKNAVSETSNLRARALGGALVLGWSTVTALWLLAGMSPWTAIGVLGCVLLAAVMVLALIYMRLPDTPSSEPSAF